MLRRFAFIFLLTAATAAAQTAGSKDTTDLRGIVVNINGGPLTASEVSLENSSGFRRHVMTNREGRFQFYNIPTGDYQLQIRRAGFYLEGGKSGYLQIHVSTKAVESSLRFVLKRGGVITGRVMSEDGRPLIGAMVTAIAVKDADGKRLKSSERRYISKVDDRGIYRVHSLAPGKYVIGVGHGLAMNLDSLWNYITSVFYADAGDEEEATEIEVKGSEVTDGVDLTVPTDPGHAVAGRIVPPPGLKAVNMKIALRRASMPRFRYSAYSDQAGAFVFEAVRNGKYSVTIPELPDRGVFLPETSIEVRDEEISSLMLELKLAGFLGATIIRRDDPRPLPGVVQAISLVNVETGTSIPGRLREAGQVTFSSIPPGQYMPRVQWSSEDWYFDGWMRGDEDLGLAPMTIGEAEEIGKVQMRASHQAAVLDGSVEIGSGHTASQTIWLVLVLEDNAARSAIGEDTFVVRANPEKRVHIGNLVPGKYKWLIKSLSEESEKDILTASQLAEWRKEAARCPDSIDLRAGEHRTGLSFRLCNPGPPEQRGLTRHCGRSRHVLQRFSVE